MDSIINLNVAESLTVMPAKAGIQASVLLRYYLDSRLRGNDN
jgi:hypothetical protein